jgi:hypothetical protein
MTRITTDEQARLGTTIYAEKVLPLLKPEDDGKFVAIDVHSGDYEVDEDDVEVLRKLRMRRPNGLFWLECAGQRTAYKVRSGR